MMRLITPVALMMLWVLALGPLMFFCVAAAFKVPFIYNLAVQMSVGLVVIASIAYFISIDEEFRL